MAEDAEDRTHAATPRRLQRAREEGRAPLSREVSSAAVLAVAALALTMQAAGSARSLAGAMAGLLAQADAVAPLVGLGVALRAMAWAVVPLALVAAGVAVALTLAQTGLLLHTAALMPDLARLDPRRGLSRIAGKQTLVETGKSLLKLAAAGFAAWTVLAAAWPLLGQALLWEPGALLVRTTRVIVRLLLTVAMAQGALAAFDVLRARMSHVRSLRMSRQELRDEAKESEGDPQVKNRIRRMRMQRARKRMMEAVPRATVVVVNPTHYAVALSYDRGATAAPRVVAKGVDAVAARIREAAELVRVPVVTSPPLARALWQVELDAEIPSELFQAVAEIIAYVWRLRTPAARRA